MSLKLQNKKQKREYGRWSVSSDKTKLIRFPIYLESFLNKIARCFDSMPIQLIERSVKAVSFISKNKDKDPKIDVVIDD
jgi:hypothetical protein